MNSSEESRTSIGRTILFLALACPLWLVPACASSGGEDGDMKPVAVGDIAPDFTLPDQDGNPISLGQFRGSKNVVLYFYPRDDTSG